MIERSHQPGTWRRPAGVLAVVVVALLAGGCSNPYDKKTGAFNPEYYDAGRHGIEVRTEDKILPVRFAQEGSELGLQDTGGFNAFVDEFISRGGGTLYVDVAPGESEQATVAQLSAVAQWARTRGVRSSELVVRTAAGLRAAPITLVYLGYEADVPACPDWSKPVLGNPKNTTHSNFGCAARSNLAKMVTNAKDLVVQRQPTAIEAEVVTRAIEAYRRGFGGGEGAGTTPPPSQTGSQ